MIIDMTMESLIGNRFSNYNYTDLKKFKFTYPTTLLSNNLMFYDDEFNINYTYSFMEAITNMTYSRISEIINYSRISHRFQDSILLFMKKNNLHRLFNILDKIPKDRPSLNGLFIGIGGFNSHLLFFYLRIYTILYNLRLQHVNGGNYRKRHLSLFSSHTLLTPNQFELVYELYKYIYNDIPTNIDEMYEKTINVLMKYYKILYNIFTGSHYTDYDKITIFENDNLEISNMIRFPVMRFWIDVTRYSPKSKINYFKKIISDISYLNLNKFKFVKMFLDPNVKVNDVDFLTGAVSPVNRLRFSKTYKEKFIFNGHFNNEYEITNDHSMLEGLTEDDIFVEETYGNINIPLFLINMQSASIDWLYVLNKSIKQKTKTISKHIIDVLDKDNIELYMTDLNKLSEAPLYSNKYTDQFDKYDLKSISKEDFDNITTGMGRTNYIGFKHERFYEFKEKDSSFKIRTLFSV